MPPHTCSKHPHLPSHPRRSLPHLGRSCAIYLSMTLSLLHNQEHADLSESRITTQPTGQLLMRLPISVGHNSPASLIPSSPSLPLATATTVVVPSAPSYPSSHGWCCHGRTYTTNYLAKPSRNIKHPVAAPEGGHSRGRLVGSHLPRPRIEGVLGLRGGS